ncbi:recombinase family protein [Candidatus Saccharibacteria bacterium]|nr:recombinase family protein [Candidatus Saccharibacteria bacterium]
MNQEKYISYIPRSDLKQFSKKRVAVYSRVSRESEEKHHSIEMQMEHLEHYIESHPGWVFVDHYVDEGVTGTKLSRPAFNRMMEDCRSGKIDIILTKTVSRFGRNMAAVLDVIKELRELDVTVIFDNENLNTANPDTNFRLQFQGIQAEIESKQNSENQKWAIRNRFKAGIPTSNRTYGYQVVSSQYIVIPEEAKVVKQIYEMYLSGMGLMAIAKKLNQDNITTINGVKWRPSTLKGVLTNEKYTGDLLLQKTYRDHYLTKRKVANHGELPQYLIEDEHEAIITKETFALAQKERERRKRKNEQAKDKAKNNKAFISHKENPSTKLFTRLIRCSECKTYFNYKHISGNNRKLWVCRNFLELGKDACPNKSIPENILISITTKILEERGLIKQSDPLTNELLIRHISKIIAYKDQTLEYHLVSSEVVTISWQFISRKESWTPEMKKKAREKALIRHAKKRANLNEDDKNEPNKRSLS